VTRLKEPKNSKHAKFQSRFSYLRASRLTEEANTPESQGSSLIRFEPLVVPEKVKTGFLILFGLFLITLAFFFNTPRQLWLGSITILTSPANLLTDYIELTNIGSTLLNAGLMTLLSVATIKRAHSEVTGVLAAGVFTVTGFSFFGKNLLNSIPIVLGVILFSKISRTPFKKNLPQAIFGTALGPLVSEITFNLGLPIVPAVLLGFAAGMLAGFVLPPLSSHLRNFHMGFNLYNVGFTAGVVGMVFLALLRSMGIEVLPVSVLSSGNNQVLSIMLFMIFAAMLIVGYSYNKMSFHGYTQILSIPGKHGTDLFESAGFGISLINMSLLGCLMTVYVLAIKGEINGPVIGGIFTVVGFGAAGKNLKNVLPIICGVFIANLFNIHGASSTVGILAALFGTTLAPIAGYYGVGWGVLAGFLHMAITMNIGYLHGGMNLYNNGFSGGFVAAALVPLINTFIELRANRTKKAEKQ
jgi:hypothetical protein